jgi:hypothetical protein
MNKRTACGHSACGCQARSASRHCSTECERAAASTESGCSCGHDACVEAARERSIDGNQGEGNREADRRYREGATEFARTHEVGKKP